MKKTTVLKTAALFAVACLLVLAGCRNSVTPPSAQTDGKGSVQLSIGTADSRSTIIPETDISDFLKFRLSFTPADTSKPLNKPKVVIWPGLSDPDATQIADNIPLDAGNWNLHITAFLDDVDDNTLESTTDDAIVVLAAAVYEKQITVMSGKPVTVQAKLERIIDSGDGKFSWEIDFDQEVEVMLTPSTARATMTIEAYDPASTFIPREFDLKSEGHSSSPETLPAGYYRVKFLVDIGNGDPIEPSEILHVYQNMESKYKKEFTAFNFPETLLNRILKSWDGSKWVWDKGDGYPITKKHFGTLNGAGLGIQGVDVSTIDFDKLTASMDEVTTDNTPPGGLQELTDMIDVALIRYAVTEGSFEISKLPEASDVTAKLMEYVKNASGADVNIDNDEQSGNTTVTFDVTIGSYGYSYAVPRLTGNLSIAVPEVGGFPRVGADVTADTTTLIVDSGVSGSFEFEWMSGNGVPDVLTQPTVDDIVNGGTVISKRPASNTYTLAKKEIDKYVTAIVWRIGHFGSVPADNVIGPVQDAQGNTDIVITLDPIDTFADQDLTDKPISLAAGNKITITATAKGTIDKIQWSRYDGTPCGNGTVNLVVDEKVHDNHPGTHIVSLTATINGIPGSMNVLIRVEN